MLPLSGKIAYGMGRFGSSLLLTLLSLTSFLVYGTVFELNWFLAGVALGISYVIIGLTHWLTGYYSDKLISPLGRRKPFVIVGAPGLAISGIMVFIPDRFIDITSPGIELSVFLYYLVFLGLFKFFYAFLLTAYQAWLPEITDEVERPLVSSMQNVSNWLANGIGVVFAFITPLLFVTSPPALSELGLTMFVVFAVVEILFYLPSIVLIRERPGLTVPQRNLVYETRVALQNRTFVVWTLVVGFLSFSFSAITAQVVGFAQKVLMLNTIELLLPPALSFLGGIIIFLFVWLRAIRRYGKKRTMMLSLVLLTLLLPLTPVVAAATSLMSSQILAVMWLVPVGACMAVYYIMSYIVPADIAQVDEILTQESRSGIYTGFIGVPLNFFQAWASILLGLFMDFTKSSTGSDVFGLTWWGPVFAPFLLIAAYFLLKIDIDPDFEHLRRVLRPPPVDP
ncbi:MAG: MFS transporter [Candidatus Thorarchaeota archaeon]